MVNASPLILLARVERLFLLPALSESLKVPRAVITELQAGAHYDSAAEQVQEIVEIEIVEDLVVPEPIATWNLGPGESQVLAHALDLGRSEPVLDDLAARKCARSLGIVSIGTLGIVIQSREQGFIPAARPVIRDLQDAGIRLSSELVEASLRAVGE